MLMETPGDSAQIRRFGGVAPLDPQAADVIARLSGNGSLASLSAIDVRRGYSEARRPLAWALEEVGAVEDFDRLGPGVPPLRLIRPKASRGGLTLIFLHGGGWTVGGLDVYEPLLRRLANTLQANLIWVEYGLAPENPFPAPLQDTLAACRNVFHHAGRLGIDPKRIGIIGDSAGGNLAAVAALMNRYGQLGQRFVAQVLLYPCLDLTASMPSHREFTEGYLLTGEIYAWYPPQLPAGHQCHRLAGLAAFRRRSLRSPADRRAACGLRSVARRGGGLCRAAAWCRRAGRGDRIPWHDPRLPEHGRRAAASRQSRCADRAGGEWPDDGTRAGPPARKLKSSERT